ncbi:MAG: alpha/beta fold hydrolase [Pseudomonadota bacterium]
MNKVISFFLVFICLSSQAYADTNQYNKTIEHHIEVSRNLIKQTNPDLANDIYFVQGRSPFKKDPQHSCPKTPKKGVLFVHGLSDTTYRWHELANFFSDHCFNVYSILLPGHGTTPDDLIKTTYQQWQASVAFGVDTLRKNSDQIFLVGSLYSTAIPML